MKYILITLLVLSQFGCQSSISHNEADKLRQDNEDLKNRVAELEANQLKKESSEKSTAPVDENPETIHGDFDGDGIQEIGKLIETPVEEEEDEMNCEITFSSSIIPPIIEKYCFKLSLLNEGDLNDDGADELSVIRTNRHHYEPFSRMTCITLKNGKWEEILSFNFSTNVEKTIPIQTRIQKSGVGKIKYIESELKKGHERDFSVDGAIDENGPDYQDVVSVIKISN